MCVMPFFAVPMLFHCLAFAMVTSNTVKHTLPLQLDLLAV